MNDDGMTTWKDRNFGNTDFGHTGSFSSGITWRIEGSKMAVATRHTWD